MIEERDLKKILSLFRGWKRGKRASQMNTVNLVASLHHEPTRRAGVCEKRGRGRGRCSACTSSASLSFNKHIELRGETTFPPLHPPPLSFALPSLALLLPFFFFASKRASNLSTFITAHCSLSGNFVPLCMCLLQPPPGNLLNVYFFSLS